jgi:membrane protease YdiL (CAAX protease family)
LRVPWGWLEVGLLVVLGVIGSIVITWGMAQIAVRFFGVNSNEIFGETITTAKSVVVLLSQALLDGFAVLYLYLMLAARTAAPFWQSIGWREMRQGSGKIRDSALQFLAGGAVLAIVVSFAGGFLNSKTTLPIEELLKARVSIVLFGILGVLVAPLVEETIFRGFLYPVIARRLGGAFRIDARGAVVGRVGTDCALDFGGCRADVGARADRHRGGQLFCAPRLQWLAARRLSDLCRQWGASLAIVGQA